MNDMILWTKESQNKKIHFTFEGKNITHQFLNLGEICKQPIGSTFFGISIGKSYFFEKENQITRFYEDTSAFSFTANKSIYWGTQNNLWAIIVENYNISLDLIINNIPNIGVLRYINGCTSTILIDPKRYGDPSLHYLNFPTNVKQTWHTHPSHRCGLVIRGKGFAETNSRITLLTSGTVFTIYPDTNHRFITTNEKMEIVTFHPWTEWGPVDEDHPMLNHTFRKDKYK
jgi:mannose-6-phosphate isomerase-like protein (cupin superfamily)